MIVHMVMIKLKADSPYTAQAIQAALEGLPAQINEIVQYEVGVDELGTGRSYDVSLYSRFESYDTMQTYQTHPEHVKVLEMIRASAQSVHAVDYTLPD